MNNYGFYGLNGARCRIMGLGRSNEALIKYLNSKGAEIYVSDKRKSENEIADVLQNNGIKNAKILPYNDISKVDYVFRTPAIRCDAHEIVSLMSKGAILSSEVELFFEIARGKIYGITGSDGKTTTTTLAYEIIKDKYGEDNVFLGGNIGIPLISFADKLKVNGITVCELSSFQLMTLKRSPERSAITNITENHLDYHLDIDEYINSKCRIVGDLCKRLVISEKAYKVIKDRLKYRSFELMLTSLTSSADIYAENGKIVLNGEEILDISDIRVSGRHNIENFMTAIGISFPEADKRNVLSVAKRFNGVAHRNELVREVNGVRYYNCSIDSTPSRTLATLVSHIGEDITLICGGYDKKLDFSEFSRVAPTFVNRFVLFGENKNKISSALNSNTSFDKKVYSVSDLKSAVLLSAELSKNESSVVLSPASASFDMFADFEERGNLFKTIVNLL